VQIIRVFYSNETNLTNEINSGSFRCSAACAYYTPFADQPNFTVLTNATATRILFSETLARGSIRATAVEYVSNGQINQVSVGREVIVSAGTIGTPKVMELSGVGNATYVYFLSTLLTQSGMIYSCGV
jgi:choline dehydrogenase-like flavoprotein